MHDGIAVLDFGSQTSQLIARRVREAKVYCELFPWNAPAAQVLALRPKGFILSGGPASVYAPGAPQAPAYVLEAGVPVLGICYGMQALAHALGGQVAAAAGREYGPAVVETVAENRLLPPGQQPVWMSHGDRIERLPEGFAVLAASPHSPSAAMGDERRGWYGLQFHPEVRHTPGGSALLRRFVVEICGARADWTPESIIAEAVERIRAQVGGEPVLAAVSGGVDSSVAAALVHRAVGDQLRAVFVENGLLRQDEREQVELAFREHLGADLTVVDASATFLARLAGQTDPEAKRRAIGETFIRVFEQSARQLGQPRFLVQGTIYPDVVESSAPDRAQGQRIKSHHNVGGLPEDMAFSLVEPLRYLFKDEVRAVGEALGLPAGLVWRQPFPGPGLAVRCLGEVTAERLARLRAADAIFTGELMAAGLLGRRPQEEEGDSALRQAQDTTLRQAHNVPMSLREDITLRQAHNVPMSLRENIAQAFVALLPVRSVGVMGDQRTYQETVALRAVTTSDFMTADWARLPYDLLARVANRIVNEVDGINRVVYDITSKPPATIEWE